MIEYNNAEIADVCRSAAAPPGTLVYSSLARGIVNPIENIR